MEADMDKDISNILCTKVDEHAGDWPSESFLELFRIAKKCVEPKMSLRPEIDDVSATFARPLFNAFWVIVIFFYISDISITGIACDKKRSSLCRARKVQEKEVT